MKQIIIVLALLSGPAANIQVVWYESIAWTCNQPGRMNDLQAYRPSHVWVVVQGKAITVDTVTFVAYQIRNQGDSVRVYKTVNAGIACTLALFRVHNTNYDHSLRMEWRDSVKVYKLISRP
jgi:hypothetical protein